MHTANKGEDRGEHGFLTQPEPGRKEEAHRKQEAPPLGALGGAEGEPESPHRPHLGQIYPTPAVPSTAWASSRFSKSGVNLPHRARGGDSASTKHSSQRLGRDTAARCQMPGQGARGGAERAACESPSPVSVRTALLPSVHCLNLRVRFHLEKRTC